MMKAEGGGGERSGDDYYDKLSLERASVASDQSRGAGSRFSGGGSGSGSALSMGIVGGVGVGGAGGAEEQGGKNTSTRSLLCTAASRGLSVIIWAGKGRGRRGKIGGLKRRRGFGFWRNSLG
jgi:hypothetical protein